MSEFGAVNGAYCLVTQERHNFKRRRQCCTLCHLLPAFCQFPVSVPSALEENDVLCNWLKVAER